MADSILPVSQSRMLQIYYFLKKRLDTELMNAFYTISIDFTDARLSQVTESVSTY